YESAVALESGKETEWVAELKPLPTSIEFAESFVDLSQWDVPKEWKVEKELLHVSGPPGIGLPKNKYYKNCEISFNLRFMSMRGAAWIVRAKDQNNYYLFWLNGSTGRFPNQLRTYICRNGTFDPANPAAPSLPIPILLRTDEDYSIHIQVLGKR